MIADHPHLASEEGHWVEQIQVRHCTRCFGARSSHHASARRSSSQAVAKEFQIDIVAGSIVEKNEAEWNDRRFNTFVPSIICQPERSLDLSDDVARTILTGKERLSAGIARRTCGKCRERVDSDSRD